MKHLFTAMLITCCSIGTASADVTTSTTCSVGTQEVSNPTNCAINSPNNAPPNTLASAAANITINQLTPVPSQGSFTSFTVNVTGSTTAIPVSNIGSGPNISSSAAATADITYQFSTPGPVRSGLISISSGVNLQSGAGFDSVILTASIGSLNGSCSGEGGLCNGFLSLPGTRSFAFTLGDTFTFNFSEAFQAFGDPYVEGSGFARGSAGLNLQLFEADGKTPVAISAAPEPSSFSLLLLAAPAAWLYRRKRQCNAKAVCE